MHSFLLPWRTGRLAMESLGAFLNPNQNMTNEDSLGFAGIGVDVCEAELSRLDAISRQIEVSKEGIQKLSSDNRDIRDNVDGDAKKRAASLATNATHLELAQGDLRILERNLEAQKKRVAEVGKIALSRIMQVWSALHQHCKAAAEREIRATYDVGRLFMAPDHLANCRLDVLLAKQMQDSLFSVQHANPNGLMLELRRLRERLQQVSDAVADEPGLVLNLARAEESAAEPTAAKELALV
jgi:hypothetical protein